MERGGTTSTYIVRAERLCERRRLTDADFLLMTLVLFSLWTSILLRITRPIRIPLQDEESLPKLLFPLPDSSSLA